MVPLSRCAPGAATLLGLVLVLDALTAAAKTADQLDVVCSAPGAHLVQTYSGVDLALEKAGKAWVRTPEGFGFLTMPGCKTELVSKDTREGSIDFVNARGDFLYQRRNLGPKNDEPEGVFLLRSGAKEPMQLELPAGFKIQEDWHPIVSDDGSALVWLETHSIAPRNIEHRIKVRDLASGQDRMIVIQNEPWRSQLHLMGANLDAGEFVVSRYRKDVLSIDNSGKLKSEPIRPSEVESIIFSSEFCRVNGGWVAWDITRMDGANRLQWSTPRGSGTKQLEGTSFESVAVDPSGKLIAFSTDVATVFPGEGELSIFRVEDGREIFHRNLKKYSRIRLAFLGSDHLALTSKGGTDVVRIPKVSDVSRLQEDAPPEVAGDGTSPMMKDAMQRAKMFGLTLEHPTDQTRTDILGRWKMYCLMPRPECRKGYFFREFRDDGYTYSEDRDRMGTWSINDNYIELKDRFLGKGPVVFVMSGGFYVLSFEMGLMRIEKEQ